MADHGLPGKPRPAGYVFGGEGRPRLGPLRHSVMNDLRRLAPWLAAGLAGALVAAWAFPRVYPLFPQDWTVTAGEAEAIALERLDDLPGAELVADAYVVTNSHQDHLFERRLLLAARETPPATLRDSELGRRIFEWQVDIYPPAAVPRDWAYRIRVNAAGEVTSLEANVDPQEEGGALSAADAVARADAFLRAQGFALDAYRRPEVRSRDRQARTDVTLRYVSHEQLLGEEIPYGLEVELAGDRLTGFTSFIDPPDEPVLEGELQSVAFYEQVPFLSMFFIAAFASVIFLRRYHAGEVGVRRGMQIFLVSLGASLALVLLIAAGATSLYSFGVLTRRQVTWTWGVQFLVVFYLPLALVSFLSWSVGESLCRERWSGKLAAFDALLQRRWSNATVARAAVRGLAAGGALLGATLLACVALGGVGATPMISLLAGELWMQGKVPGLALLLYTLPIVFYRELFGRLLLVSWLRRRMGPWLGAAVATVVGGLFLFPFYMVVPLPWSIFLWLGHAGALVALFLAYDLLTVLVAGFTFQVATGAMALIATASPSLELQGWAVLAVAALPAALSLRYLGSGQELVYRWDDVPPHVRRIAERERQRVELETARRIQSSILPDLPPRLAGVDIAHSYLPASEVGGDFYDALALEDGRLAVAVGDVAGHGVSSGLVMSAAKSALAVQVTFDPGVEAVFATLNRLVYQSARRRLLATLCYALLDPAKRELVFASAGHLYPYLLKADGRVSALTSTAYPLGVRPTLEIAVTKERLDPHDALVLLSDGLVEAEGDVDGDVYGFERLEESLRRHAEEPVGKLRDGVLADLVRFTGSRPRSDDQTLLVLRIP